MASKVIGDLFDKYTASKGVQHKPNEEALKVLNIAKHHYDNMSSFRKEGMRCHDFVNGKQWGDLIYYDGETITEEEALVRQGYNPRTTNFLNRVIKNVMGVVLKSGNEPTAYSHDGSEQAVCDVFNVLLGANNTLNCSKLLWPQQFKQFLEWGAIIGKVTYGYGPNNKLDNWVVNIDPRSFFCDTGTMDIRGWDCDMVGQLHTLPIEEVLSTFATGKPKVAREKHKKICDVFKKCTDRKYVIGTFANQFGRNKLKTFDFLFPENPDMCRVIEVWTKESREVFYVHDTMTATLDVIKPEEYEDFVESVNNSRIELARLAGVSEFEINTALKIVDDPQAADEEGLVMPPSCPLRIPEWKEERYWYYRFIAPDGTILEEGESKLIHKGHPFVYVLHPFTNGEVRSYTSDLIDEQKNANRNYTMWDMVSRISMKGFTAFDRNALPDEDPDGDALHKVLAQPGGSYGFNLKPGEQIQNKVVQMSTNNTGIGLMEMIQLSSKNIEDISGVNGALQGKPGFSTTSGSLYYQQTQNATGSLLDVVECYYAFLMNVAYKQCSNMFQYYDKTKVEKIAGAGAWDTLMAYRESLNDDKLELDFKMLESTSSPVYRQMSNDYLQAWLQMGLIDFPTMLKIGNFAFSDKLLVALDKRNQEALTQGGQALPESIPQQGNEEEAAVAGVRAAMAGSGQNTYNQMAATKKVMDTINSGE